MSRVRLLALLALAWLVATGEVGACNLFRPATPEGRGNSVIVPSNYSDPDSTLTTLARGIEAKGNGQTAYLGGFADTTRDGRQYNAGFDPTVVARYLSQPGAKIPDPWSTDNERQFFSSFVQYRSVDYAMTWTLDTFHPDPPPDPDAALLHRAYKVETVASDGSRAVIAVGYADLSFIRSPAGRWVIVFWNDRADPAYGGANPSNPDQVCIGWRRLNP